MCFQNQPLFLRANNSTCNQRLWPLLTQRKRKSLIAGFCYHRRGKRSDIFQLALITSQRIEKSTPTFSSRCVGFTNFLPFYHNNHSYYFLVNCPLLVSNSHSQSESTNAFKFWHLFFCLLNASADHVRPLHVHVIGTSLVLLFSPSLTGSN